MEILSLITLVLKFAVMVFEKYKKTEPEKRSSELAKVDEALTKGRATRDLSELSERMGRGL